MTKPRVLIIDDDSTIRTAYSKYLSSKDYYVRSGSSLHDMDKLISKYRYDALLLDILLPDGNSLERIEELRRDYPDMAIVTMTGHGGLNEAVEAMRLGADNFFTKPVPLEDLHVFLKKALEVEGLRRKDQVAKRRAPGPKMFVGSTPAWSKAMELAEIAAANEAAVLLLGETGTGKGMLARWIHEQSERSAQPFVGVNCSSLRGEMLASELFGHVKGAFTSAVADKQGLVEVATDGTLFLDEIGDMDLSIQAQFLKVIEEKRFRRLGDVKDRSSDFRLLCATNQDLKDSVRQKTFREDLFFRINVFPIQVPPLRDMKEDIPALAEHILSELSPEDVAVAEDVIPALQAYSWPGNVRELRNVLERALLLAHGTPLSLKHLPGLAGGESLLSSKAAEPTLNLELLEEERIRSAMERFDGNAGKAAEALGISRATIYRRLKGMKVRT